MNETETDILEFLREQGVAAVRRITIRRDGNEIKTKRIFTFDRQSCLASLLSEQACFTVR